jgi:hypothetical protein
MLARLCLSIWLLWLTVAAFGQSKPPVGSLENPKQITSSDRGPDIDAVKLCASKFNGSFFDVPQFHEQ